MLPMKQRIAALVIADRQKTMSQSLPELSFGYRTMNALKLHGSVSNTATGLNTCSTLTNE